MKKLKILFSDLKSLYRIWRLMRTHHYIMTFDNGITGEVLYNLRSRKHFKRLLAITRQKCVF